MEDAHVVAHQREGREWLRDGERCFPIDRYSHDDREALAKTFAEAHPFPHLVLDDFLNLDPAAAEMFPDFDWDRWHRFGDDYQRQKVTCDDIEAIPEPFAMAIRESSAPTFLKFLEHVTGIPKLIPDPFLTGGGLHLSGPGGVLAPHTDFHNYERLGLFRRLNVLVYLNPGWTPEMGGTLGLYREGSDEPVKTVVPTWGKCVVFRTDHHSVHGVTQPVAEGHWRRSIALYYFTSADTKEFSGDGTTYWRTHAKQTGVRRVRLGLYRSILRSSELLAKVAHRLNPLIAD